MASDKQKKEISRNFVSGDSFSDAKKQEPEREARDEEVFESAGGKELPTSELNQSTNAAMNVNNTRRNLLNDAKKRMQGAISAVAPPPAKLGLAAMSKLSDGINKRSDFLTQKGEASSENSDNNGEAQNQIGIKNIKEAKRTIKNMATGPIGWLKEVIHQLKSCFGQACICLTISGAALCALLIHIFK